VTPLRGTALLVALWALLYAALALLLAWSRDGIVTWLGAAALATASAAVLRARFHASITSRTHATIAILLLTLGCALALYSASRLHRLGTHWEQLQTQRSAGVRQALEQRMALVLAQGRQVATQAAMVPSAASRRVWFEQLQDLQRTSNVDALAVFGEQGELLAWSGEHRGRLPDGVRLGPEPVIFVERPLYSYLYFNAPLEGRSGSVMVAILLDAALPAGVEEPGLAAQMGALAGRNATFLPGPGTAGDWSLVTGGDTLVHVRLEPINQTEWRLELLRAAQRFLAVLALLVLVTLGLGWFRDPARPLHGTAVLPFLGMASVVFAAPLGSIFGLEELFSPGLFLFPGPGEISLGSLLAVLLVCGAFVATARVRWPARSPVWFVLLAILLTATLPIAVKTLIGPSPPEWEQFQAWTPTLLQGGAVLWVALQFALVLLYAVWLTFVLITVRLPTSLLWLRRRRPALILLGGSALLAGALALLVLLVGRTREQVTPLLSLLWVLPILMAGAGIAAQPPTLRRLTRWLMAGWIGGTALLPYIWTAQVHERLRTAERELATLGSKPDPYLQYVLRQFGREAIARRERGEDGLQLLYRSWVSSGLARDAYPVRITIWDSDERPEVQLPLGDAFSSAADQLQTVPPYLAETFASVQELGHWEIFTARNVEGVNQVLVVPLEPERMITVEVPPRRTLERASVIAPILGSSADPGTRLELVPKRTASTGGVWRPTEEGWRSEVLAHFPDGDFHAHLRIRLPGVGVEVARGVLILAADLLLLLGLWLAGCALRNESVTPRRGWFGWLASFRARVTAALFVFFLLPTAIFGWVAYSALAQEVTRAARIVAERTVEQAVLEFPEVHGDLGALAERAGAEVLLYFQGELQSVSSPEALELGVYNAWMPWEVFLDLEGGDEESGVARPRIGNQDFITAFRRLRPAGTGEMAVPVSVQSGETALRQQEMAHLILFAALMGALLSLALSMAVGRALAGPIGRLQRAAAAVGEGRLRVQLPEQSRDEFGRLFASFNRMVRQLRRARTQEVRTARVLAWGEMARQVAHEIKNPLTPIKLAVQHLRRAYGDRRGDFEQVLDRSVDQILVEIDRLSDIARAFSRYGAPPESAGPLTAVDVGSVIHEALTLYRAGDPNLQYTESIDPGLPLVLARPGELKEVILNLLENARAATAPPGRISLVANRDGDAVELRVEDTGVGIPSELLPRIFEPHFSTRTTGTGLGLAIVRRLAESWGASVRAESEAGHGTTIRVRLPIARSELA
jgi:signal transduction histidine kinase